MQAGRLRHWLTFETLLSELDSDGATVETWIPAFDTSARMPCEVTALSGRELIAAQAIQSKISTRIRTRYRPGFKPKMRAIQGAIIYNIEAVILDPESGIRSVTLLASSGVNEG